MTVMQGLIACWQSRETDPALPRAGKSQSMERNQVDMSGGSGFYFLFIACVLGLRAGKGYPRGRVKRD